MAGAISHVSSPDWANCIEHVIKKDKMCQLERLVDTLMEPFTIDLGNNGDSSVAEWERTIILYYQNKQLHNIRGLAN